MKGKMKPNRTVRMAEIKLGILKAIMSALGKRKAAQSTSSSGSGLEKEMGACSRPGVILGSP